MRLVIQDLVNQERKTIATGDDYITIILHDGTEFGIREIVQSEKQALLDIRILSGMEQIKITPRTSYAIWIEQEKER